MHASIIHDGFLPAPESVVFSNCSDGDTRLVGGVAENEGRVEVCINRAWGSICYYRYNDWDVRDTRVVCRQHGHQELGMIASGAHSSCYLVCFECRRYRTSNSQFGQGSGPVFLASLGCTGSELNLLQCPHTPFVGDRCTHSRDFGVRCRSMWRFCIL